MDMHQIRLLNLESLIKKQGSAAKIASLIGSSPTVLSVIRSDKHPDKNMGGGMARRIEDALSLPHGWMDRLHDEPAETEKTSPIVNNQNSYTSSKTADQVIKEIINSVNSGRLSDEDVVLLGAMAKKIQRAPEPIDYSTHYPGLIDEDT